MTFEELHEAIEGENPVSEKEAIHLINSFSKDSKQFIQDVLSIAAENISESILFLDDKYNEIIKALCLLKNEPMSVYESKAIGDTADFLKITIKQLNRSFKKIEKLSKKRR